MSKTIRFAFLVFIFFFGATLNAQIHSEAPITFIDGKMYTDMFYVKFKSHDVLPTVTGETRANGHAISTQFPEIRGIFNAFVRSRSLNLEDIVIRKAIPRSMPTDEVYLDPSSGEERKLPDLSKIYLVEFPEPVDVESIIARLKVHPEVEYSHGPVQVVQRGSHTPNDPKYLDGTQWYLDLIKAPEAWDITKGSSSIKIGIIEATGVAQQDHPDLDSDIVPGGDTTPVGTHATQVAGLAGAVTDDNIGIASLGWNTKILTYTFTGGPANRSLIADKIDEAVSDGARVLNMSFETIRADFSNCQESVPSGGLWFKNVNYPTVEEAIEVVIQDNNVVIVAVAGNSDAPLLSGHKACENIPFPQLAFK